MQNKNTNQILKALSYYGEDGIIGEKSNPVILDFFKKARNEWVTNDDVPWCAAFVNAVLYDCKMPTTDKLNARSFLEWGVPTLAPEIGDVVVLWRGSKDSVFGHVGFFIKEDHEEVYILGGNQDNTVSIKAFPKHRLLQYRTGIIN